MAEAIGPSCEKPIVGIRPGEKVHEEMITASDSFTTIDLGSYYAILPSDGRLQQRYQEAGISSISVPSGFAYNSGSNPAFPKRGSTEKPDSSACGSRFRAFMSIHPTLSIPYGRQTITEADIAAVVSVLHSPFLTQGPVVPVFEQAVAAKVDAATAWHKQCH